MTRETMFTLALLFLAISIAAPMAYADEVTATGMNKTMIDDDPNYPSYVFEPSIFYTGGYYTVPYLLVTNNKYAEGDLYVAQVTGTGSIARTITIEDTDVVIMYHAAASGNRLFLAYDRWVDKTYRRDIYYAVIDTGTGTILKQGMVVNAEGYQEYVAVAYSPGLDRFAVAYFDSNEQNIYVKIYDSNGNQVAETGFIPIGHDYYYAAFTLIGGQNGFLLLYNYEQFGQRDLSGEYITGDGTTTHIDVYSSLDANETPGYNFNIYNPVTGYKSRVMQPIPGAYLDGYFIAPFASYTSSGQQAYVAVIKEDTLDVQVITLGPGDHPQAVAGTSNAMVVYRDTSSGTAGDIKAVLISVSGGSVSTSEIYLSTEMGTSDSREGYAKVGYSPARDWYVVSWAYIGETEKYEAIATTVRSDGELGQGYSVLEDNAATSNTPFSVAADDSGGFAVLVSLSYKPATNNTDLEIIVGQLGQDIPSPIYEATLVPATAITATVAALLLVFRRKHS